LGSALAVLFCSVLRLQRAVIATARKLAVLLHRLWVSGEAYEPLRNSRAMPLPAWNSSDQFILIRPSSMGIFTDLAQYPIHYEEPKRFFAGPPDFPLGMCRKIFLGEMTFLPAFYALYR
jgi:hypothetical protein